VSPTVSAHYNRSLIGTGKSIVTQIKLPSSIPHSQHRDTRSVSFGFRATKTSQDQNIPGNEIADQLAKLSTAKPSSNPPKCVLYKRVNTRLNFTDMLPYLYNHSFHAWEIQYQTDTKRNAYKVIFPALLRSSLSTHSLSTIIFCLCTGHCQLNHHMSRIGLHSDRLCNQCEIPETVEHVIEVCPKFSEARRRLKHAVEDLGINFSTPEILRRPAAAKHVEAFV